MFLHIRACFISLVLFVTCLQNQVIDDTEDQDLNTSGTTLPRSSTTSTVLIPSTNSSNISTPGDISTDQKLETTSQSESTTSLESTSATTESQPTMPMLENFVLFECDFSTPCLSFDQFDLTNGTEFQPGNSSELPVAPTSDVSSITLPTRNKYICRIPFSYETVTNASELYNKSSWFCYDGLCETLNAGVDVCEMGQYGYVKLEKNKDEFMMENQISLRPLPFGSYVQQLMFSFYYFFTVYQNTEVGQKLEFGFKNETDPMELMPLAVLTIKNVSDDGWQFISIPLIPDLALFERPLYFSFGIEPTFYDNAAESRPIYFALDNIKVNSFIIRNETETTLDTTETGITTTVPTEPGDNLPLILGLTLGLGLPIVLVAVGGLGFYLFKSHKKRSYDIGNTRKSGRMDEYSMQAIEML